MPSYDSFEDLPVWKSANELATLIYKVTSRGNFSRDSGLRDQIQRAAVSVSSNIAEGFERGTKQELIQFLYIARGSCGELRSQLFIARDIGYFDSKEFDGLYNGAKKVSKQISGFIEYLRTAHILGQKFHDRRSQEAKQFLEELQRIRKK